MGCLSILRGCFGTLPRRHGGPITFEDLSKQVPPRRLPPLDRPGVDEDRRTPEQAAWRRSGASGSVMRQSFTRSARVRVNSRQRARPGQTTSEAVLWTPKPGASANTSACRPG